MLGAEPGLAGRLRRVAAERFAAANEAARPKGTLLGRIGPLMRRPIDVPAPPAGPGPLDVENLIAARSVDPARLLQCWQILQVWVEDAAWGHLDLTLDAQDLNDIEFDLVKAGLPSQYCLQQLFAKDPQLALRPAAQLSAGYSRHGHALATYTALTEIISEADADTQPLAVQVMQFLGLFQAWGRSATAGGRPAPDLFAIRWS